MLHKCDKNVKIKTCYDKDKVSFEIPEYTADVDGTGVMRLLEIIRSLPTKKFWKLKKKLNFIKQEPANYMEKYWKRLKMKTLHLIQYHQICCRKIIRILYGKMGRITEKVIIYLQLMVYYLITKVHEEVKIF